MRVIEFPANESQPIVTVGGDIFTIIVYIRNTRGLLVEADIGAAFGWWISTQ